MDSFEFNKIAGAVLGTALVVFGLNELSKIIYHAHEPEKQGFAIEVAEAAGSGEAAAETPAAPAESLGTMLASARDYIASGKLGRIVHVKVYNMLDGSRWEPVPDGPALRVSPACRALVTTQQRAGFERTESGSESNRATSRCRAATAWHMQIGAAPRVVSRNPEMKTPNR